MDSLKGRLIDMEVITAFCLGAVLMLWFHTSWLIAILSSLSVFLLIPLLFTLAYYIKAIWFLRGL